MFSILQYFLSFLIADSQVRGYGLSADAYHITQPAPDGRGALLAMQRALCKSGVTATDIAYVNAHATSTPLGDAVEAAAIAKLFNFPQADAAESMLANAMEPTGHLLPSLYKHPYTDERRD